MTKTPAAGSYMQIKINGNFVTIPGVESIPPFGPKKSFYENTAIDDAAKTYNADLPDPGEFTITGSWDSKDAAHAHMLASAADVDATDEIKTVWNSGATSQVNVLILSFVTSGQRGQDEKFECNMKLSGTVNYTAAT